MSPVDAPGFTESNMGGGIPPGSTGKRPFANRANQQGPNLGLANRDGQASRLAAQTRQYEGMYAPPTQGGMNPLTGEVSWHEELTENSKNVPSNYNMAHGGAVKYTTDSAHKENFRDRAAIRAGIVENGGQVNFVESIQDSDVKMMQEARDTIELANFDRYATSWEDPRSASGKEWLDKHYPEYMQARVGQIEADFNFAVRNQCIDMFGFADKPDMDFKFLVDQGIITGPSLMREVFAVSNYAPGYLSPWKFMNWMSDPKISGDTLKLPFNSAKFGARPNKGQEWAFKNDNAVLGMRRTSQDIANDMYQHGASGNRSAWRPNSDSTINRQYNSGQSGVASTRWAQDNQLRQGKAAGNGSFLGGLLPDLPGMP